MKRSLTIVLAAAAVIALAGCQSSDTGLTRAPSFGGGAPAYVSMSSGDRLGAIMVENRIYTARINHENNAYATVDTETLGD